MSDLGNRLRELAADADENNWVAFALVFSDREHEVMIGMEAADVSVKSDSERLMMTLGLSIYQATNMQPAKERSN